MSPAPDDIARVARALRNESDQLLDSIAARVWETVPGYSRDVLDRADLRARIGDSVTNVIACLAEGRDPSDAELARSARNGERRALQGVSSTAIIQSYRTAERILSEELQGWCARMQVRPVSARSARAALIRHLDQLEGAMLAAYAEIQAQVDAEDRLSEPTLFRRLASGESIDSAEIEQLAVAVGLADPDRVRVVALAVAAPSGTDRTAVEQHRHRVAGALGRALGTTVLSGVVDRPGGAVVLLALPSGGEPEALVPDVDRALARTDDAPLRGALGRVVQGLAALGVSCRQALDALEATAPRDGAAASNGVVLHTDALLEILIQREPVVARQLAEHHLGPLAGHPELLATLETHVAQGLALSATARALGVHKNTVVYRLHRTTELTGLDLRRPYDVARLVVALAVRPPDGRTT